MLRRPLVRHQSSCSNRDRGPTRHRSFRRPRSGSASGELLGAPDVVDVVRIPAVDQDVVCLEQRQRSWMLASTTAAGTISQMARGLLSFSTNSASDAAPCAPSDASSATALGVAIVDDAGVPIAKETAHHVRAHPAETDHSELHHELLVRPARPHHDVISLASGSAGSARSSSCRDSAEARRRRRAPG